MKSFRIERKCTFITLLYLPLLIKKKSSIFIFNSEEITIWKLQEDFAEKQSIKKKRKAKKPHQHLCRSLFILLLNHPRNVSPSTVGQSCLKVSKSGTTREVKVVTAALHTHTCTHTREEKLVSSLKHVRAPGKLGWQDLQVQAANQSSRFTGKVTSSYRD